MADDLDKEYADLMERKGEDTETPEEIAGAAVEREQSQADDAAQGDQQQQQDKSAEGATDADKKAQSEKKDELPLEEIKKRWEDQKGATAKERQERRAAIARAEAAEQRAATIEARFQQIIAELQAKANKAPDPEEDVVGALKATQQQLQQFQQVEAQRRQQAAIIAQQNQIATTIQHKVEDYETEFKSEHPDYDEALDYVLDLKEGEFEAVGYPKKQAQAAAAQWAMNAAALMLQQGINPAEAGYQQAMKLGFKPKAAANGAGAQDPDAQALAAAEKQRQEGAQKIAQIKDGQAAGSKMAGGGSGAQNDGSLKSGLQLQGAAFDSWAEKFLRQQTRA